MPSKRWLLVLIIYMVGTCIEQMTEWVAGERMESHRREGLDDHTAEGDQVPYCQRDSGICFFSLQQLETVTVSECAFSQCENNIFREKNFSPHHETWASLIPQLVKNLPAMQETPV